MTTKEGRFNTLDHQFAHDVVANTKPRFCMLMMSGTVIDCLDPKPETILVDDIVQCLGNEARFCGNIDYTVLAHSLVVAELTLSLAVRSSGTFTPNQEKLIYRCGLLHDATETYCRDLPRDLKRAIECREIIPHDIQRVLDELDFGYKAAESRFMRAICSAFRIQFKDVDLEAYEALIWVMVKEADEEALAAEVQLFWPRQLQGHFSCGKASAPALRHTEQYGAMPRDALRESFRKALAWSLS